MDFRRPGEHPIEDTNHRHDGTNGMMPPVHPFQQVIVPPKKNKGLNFFIWFLVLALFGAIGYGVYAYLNEQTLRSQLSVANNKVKTLTTDKVLLENQQAKTEKKTDAEMTEEDKIELETGVYVCNIDKFGCDKVSMTITKLQKYVAPGPGFAIVKVTSATNVTTNLYLRTMNGTDWVVVYEGAAAPSNEVAKRYAIPADFTRLP